MKIPAFLFEEEELLRVRGLSEAVREVSGLLILTNEDWRQMKERHHLGASVGPEVDKRVFLMQASSEIMEMLETPALRNTAKLMIMQIAAICPSTGRFLLEKATLKKYGSPKSNA